MYNLFPRLVRNCRINCRPSAFVPSFTPLSSLIAIFGTHNKNILQCSHIHILRIHLTVESLVLNSKRPSLFVVFHYHTLRRVHLMTLLWIRRVKPTPYFTTRKPTKRVLDSGRNQVLPTEICTLRQLVPSPLIWLRESHFLRQFLEQIHLPRMYHRLRFLPRLLIQSTVIGLSIAVNRHQPERLFAIIAGPTIITDESRWAPHLDLYHGQTDRHILTPTWCNLSPFAVSPVCQIQLNFPIFLSLCLHHPSRKRCQRHTSFILQ